MQIFTTHESPEALEADVLVLGVYADGDSPAGALFDKQQGGVIRRLGEAKEWKPEVGDNLPLYLPVNSPARIVLLAGLGTRDQCHRGAAFRAMASASRWITTRERSQVVFSADPDWTPDVLESAVAGSIVGCEGPGLYQAEPKRKKPRQIHWALPGAELTAARLRPGAQSSPTSVSDEVDSVAQGRILGEAINLTRRLVNEPPSVIFPESFANEAARIANETGMEIEIWDQARLEKERCGALLAVARGSSRPPRMVILRYRGPGSSNTPQLGWIGKGVTFDSGGLSLKPTEGMTTMKCDMAGAATVLGAMQAVALLKLPIHIVGLMGLVENMPGDSAFQLGDVLKARNGKTIEVLNTDAEGRLVLADVLTVAVEQKAEKLIDLATLTGACVVALGMDVAGLMTNNQTWCDQLRDAADRCGEPVWQLPMFAEYGEQIKSPIADMKNTGDGRWGGAITAAKLLEQFIDDRPWIHIDIAGPAYLEKPKSWMDIGGSGALVRTLVEIARRHATP
jgi:leucyl aminopeptidase